MEKENIKMYAGLNKILIKEEETPTTEGLLALPVNNLKYGKIVSVGAIRDSKDIKEDTFCEGDYVYILAQAGINVDLPNGTYKLITATDVLVGLK